MTGIGHNKGPTLEAGFGFRRHAWGKARRDLLPRLPLEVVRLHVARAKRLGLDYSTYASVRATAGCDIVGFLFSGNALGLGPRQFSLPPQVSARLGDLPAGRIGAIYAPTLPEDVARAHPALFDRIGRAPAFTDTWADARTRLLSLLDGMPRRGVVLVAATAVERDWRDMARLGAVLSPQQVLPGAGPAA